MSYYPAYRQQNQDGIWDFLYRLICVLFVFVALTGIICLGFLPLVHKQKDLDRQLEELSAKVTAQRQLNGILTRKQNWLKDPDYVETIARDALDVMKPGETIIRLEPPPANGAPESTGSKLQAHP